MKILLSAFACWPTESSEPGVAWRIAKHLANDHQVWLLTDGAPGPVSRIKAFLQTHHTHNIHLVPFPGRAPHLKTTARFLSFYYHWWQASVIRAGRRLHALHQFDLVHHVTLSRYCVGNSLVKLPIPFVWGPLGAAERPPAGMGKSLPASFRIQLLMRSLGQRLFEQTPLTRHTITRAAVTFASTPDTAQRLRKLGAGDVRLVPQITFDRKRLDDLSSCRADPPTDHVSLVSAGRLVHWKGFHLAIEVVAELLRKGLNVHYSIFGDGPMKKHLQNLVVKHGLDSKVTFRGNVPEHQDVLHAIGRAHVLIHPALHEAFGNVCLEALAIGKPVVCLAIGGPSSMVTPACGYAAPIDNIGRSIFAMTDYIAHIATTPLSYQQASESALQRARDHYASHIQYAAFAKAYRDCLSAPRRVA